MIKRTEQFQDRLARLFPSDDPTKDSLAKNVTFQVTDGCNLACTYCYQISKHNHFMEFETAKKFIDMLLDEEEKNEYVDSYEAAGLIMEFIGGEPFLAIDLIDQIVDYFIRAMIERQHPWATRYMISICSNGLLYFDEKVQKFIRKHLHHLSFSISIDGNKRLHDACRVKPDGSGSYDIAMAGVRHFVDVLGGSMGSKMTLAPQNVMYTYEAVTSIIENGYDEINLNCVYEEGWTPEHALILYQELKRVADYLLEKDLDDSKVYLSIFVDSFFKPKQPDDVQNWCGGNGRMISVDWKGDIYPCIRYMESSLGDSQKPMIVGNVDRGIMKCSEECEFVRQLKEIDRKTQSTEECFNCPIAEGCSWCFEAGTKISTPNGLENIEDLKVGDLVHDMNGTPQKIIRATSHEANDLVVVRAAGFNDIVVTEEHPFYAKQVIKRNHNIPTYGEPTWVSAKDLNVSDKIAMFIPKLGDKDIHKDLAYLVGRYIGDGWKTPSGRGKTPFKYYICCNDQEQKELEDKLNSASISFSKNRNRTVNEYHLCTSSEKEKELMILLEECGRRSESKKIPREVWNWNKESVKALIEGYFAADGSIDKRHNIQRFCSINKNLIFEFAELIRAVYHKNVSITCRKGRKQKIEGRDVVAKDSFEGRFKIGEEKRKYYEYDEENNIIWANVATPKKIPPKNTKVYNIEVENNPTFIANGAIVHNCTAYNYQVFGTVNKRAIYICIMHKARALANWYYWAKLYKKQGKAPYVHYIPDEMALEVISQEELDMLKSL